MAPDFNGSQITSGMGQLGQAVDIILVCKLANKKYATLQAYSRSNGDVPPRESWAKSWECEVSADAIRRRAASSGHI